MPTLGRAFARLWVGETISAVGSQVTQVALPLTAVLVLEASAAEMGAMRALAATGGLAAALFAGVLVDRFARRRLLIASDLCFALAAGAIPALALVGALRIEHLYAIVAATGALSALSIVGSQSLLPALVPAEELTRANARLQTTVSLAGVVGPALGGWLVEVLGPPQAIAVDALSFVLAAACLAAIAVAEPARVDGEPRLPLAASVRSGFAAVYGDPRLRPLAQAIAAHFLWAGVVWSVLILFASRELGIGPLGIGLMIAAAGLGLLAGSLSTPLVTSRLGLGPTLVLGSVLIALGVLAYPLAAGPEWLALAVLSVGNFLVNLGIQLHGINVVSLRQRIAGAELLGRVNATFRFVNFATGAVGALLAAGLAADGLDSRSILAVGAVGFWIPPFLNARALSALRGQ